MNYDDDFKTLFYAAIVVCVCWPFVIICAPIAVPIIIVAVIASCVFMECSDNSRRLPIRTMPPRQEEEPAADIEAGDKEPAADAAPADGAPSAAESGGGV
ncbi:hypothetical protein U1Q18_051631 [Sarracenia purpurea var. burkii]